jgi:hypothetical protein
MGECSPVKLRCSLTKRTRTPERSAHGPVGADHPTQSDNTTEIITPDTRPAAGDQLTSSPKCFTLARHVLAHDPQRVLVGLAG